MQSRLTEGMMMNTPLTLTPILERAARLFPDKEIVWRTDSGMHRYRYRDFHQRVHRLAWAMKRLGIQPGDRGGQIHVHVGTYHVSSRLERLQGMQVLQVLCRSVR